MQLRAFLDLSRNIKARLGFNNQGYACDKDTPD